MSELSQDIGVVWRTNPYTGEYTWTYGNWGGKGWSAGQFTPPGQKPDWKVIGLTDLDKIFREHDKAYQNLEDAWNASSKSPQDIADYWGSTISADNQMRQSIHDSGVNNGWGSYPPGSDLPDFKMADAAIQADRLFALKKIRDSVYRESFRNPDTGKSGASYPSLIDPKTLLPIRRTGDLDTWNPDFGNAEQTRSPLVLDLNGDGVQTTRLSNSFTQGVHFNLDAKGLAENTAWVSKDDGLLVRDLNGDGKITSGRELFGNHTLLKSGTEAANGFEALAELDDNGDGVVDADDASFASLKVWKDANGNGVTDAGELLTLAQAGVKSFNVSYTSGNSTDANGNQHLQQGNFTKTDDSTQSMHDVWFNVDTARTQDTDNLLESDEITDLPDFVNIGNLRSLHQAMVRDETGQLQAENVSALRD